MRDGLVEIPKETYQLLFEAAQMGIWSWNLNDNSVQYDAKWCSMLGYTLAEIKPALSTFEMLVHPDDKDQVFGSVKSYLSGELSTYEESFRMLHKNGQWRWILARGQISARDEHQRPLTLTGIHLDISHLKEDEILNESIQRMGKIGGWELDAQTNITTWTPEVYQIYGIDPETPTHRIQGISYYLEHERSRISNYLNLCLEEGIAYRDTFEFLDGQGRLKWVESTGEPIRDSNHNIFKVRGTFCDVTERHNALLRLKEAQKIARLGSWSYDSIKEETYWSPTMFDILGFENSPEAPSFEEQYSRIHIEDRENWSTCLKECIKNGIDYRIQVRIPNPGSLVWVEVCGARGRKLHNGHYMVSGTCQDITTQMEKDKRIELERLKAAQSAKLASLGEMAAGVAHEINNPLSILSGNLQLIDKLQANQDLFANKIQVMEKACERIARIVRSLQKFSRSTDSVPSSEVNLQSVIEDVMPMVEAKLKQFRIEMRIRVPQNFCIQFNEIELEQIFVNLFNNAIDAIKTKDGERWIECVAHEDSPAEVSVRDSGPGIPAEVQRRVFEPFFTTKPVGEGTGLGLPIIKGLLESHGATIELQTAEPTTCFKLKFRNGA